MKPLDDIFNLAQDIVFNDFGYVPAKSTLFLHDDLDYREWCLNNNKHPDSDGVYLPQKFETHINRNCRPELSIFHEHFGHGLFCEHANIAKHLIAGTANSEVIQMAENVALWMEHRLSNKLGLGGEFREKYGSIIPSLSKMEEEYGTKIVIFHHDFAKIYNEKIIDDILRTLYGQKYDDARCALLYGSRKQHSDIDVFLIDDNGFEDEHNSWLDIHSRDTAFIEQGIANWDITVIDPIMTGSLVRGDGDYFIHLRNCIAKHEISAHAIEYNRECALMKYQWAMRQENFQDREAGMRAAKVHIAVSEELSNNRHPMTLREVREKYYVD